MSFLTDVALRGAVALAKGILEPAMGAETGPTKKRRKRRQKKIAYRASRGIRVPNKMLEMMILSSVIKNIR